MQTSNMVLRTSTLASLLRLLLLHTTFHDGQDRLTHQHTARRIRCDWSRTMIFENAGRNTLITLEPCICRLPMLADILRLDGTIPGVHGSASEDL